MAHLFVYGTLRPAAADLPGRQARRRLAGESAYRGPALIHGRLYDLGRYPGLWQGTGANGAVAGDIVLLARPAATFAWLDRYEGDEYARVRLEAEGADGETIGAWGYVLKHRPAAPVVPCGDWLLFQDPSPRRRVVRPRAPFPLRRSRRSRTGTCRRS